ncbi:MAG TPA: hypothetical protein VFJ82_24960 [Longimicrobium sp.]|nr:hypothetical protein [Longimicrobium sp.]
MEVVRWKGPDVLVIGWIPFGMRAPAGGAYGGFAGRTLFHSGNPPPPHGFGGHAGFDAWRHSPGNPVGTREYRAALYLEGVVAEFPEAAPPRIDRRANGRFLGHTPLRMYAAGWNIGRILPQFMEYSAGAGPRRTPPAANADPWGSWAELRYRADFKLGWLPNVMGRVLTGSWAPYAWCEIQYRIDRDGGVRVIVEGSAIPSQRLYIDWQTPSPASGVVPEHDMRGATKPRVDGFIRTAGWGCKPAPRGSSLSWRGRAQPC